MDLFHRKDVGWSMGKTLATADTIIPAWKMAVRSNNITDRLVFHSDRGSQYASYEFTDIRFKDLTTVNQDCFHNKRLIEMFFKNRK